MYGNKVLIWIVTKDRGKILSETLLFPSRIMSRYTVQVISFSKKINTCRVIELRDHIRFDGVSFEKLMEREKWKNSCDCHAIWFTDSNLLIYSIDPYFCRQCIFFSIYYEPITKLKSCHWSTLSRATCVSIRLFPFDRSTMYQLAIDAAECRTRVFHIIYTG